VLIAIPIMILAICNFSISSALISEDSYREAFEDERIFTELMPFVIPSLIEASNATGTDDLSNLPIDFMSVNTVLTPEDWREITTLVVPASWLKQTFGETLSVILSLLKGDESAINRTISLSEIRQRLSGDEARKAAELIVSKAPECTRTQSDQVRTFATSGEGKLPICLTDEELREVSIATITSWLNSISVSLSSDELLVSDIISQDEARVVALFVRIDGQILILLYLIPVALLALVVVLTVRSRKSFGRWIGITSIVTGAVIFLIIVMVQIILLNSIGELFNVQIGMQQFVAQLISSLMRSISNQINAILLIHAVVFEIVGFILVLSATVGNSPRVLEGGETFLITEDGRIISTSSKQKIEG